ncbi:MAG: hypothetical protein QHH15_00215 [Candidatus Thermoplasmatota archaeon]|nr:hypothetical protein [Candidatus Thermoplasmatota archaeon]
MGVIQILGDKQLIIDWLNDKITNAESKMEGTLNEILSMYWTLAQAFAPYRTGQLSESHEIEISGLEGVMYPTADYAAYVILGTRPHTIVPVSASVLAWYWGEWYFAKRVEHPGTQPNDYIEPIFQDSMYSVDNIVNEYVDWLLS